jgi:hypothetical protein
MGQEIKNSNGAVIIGRDANGAEIKINANEFKPIINQQLKLLLNERGIDKIEKQIKGLKDNVNRKIPKWVYWIWLISIIALGLSLTSIFWGYNIKWNVEIISTSIILAFVGILATFVVVSNYAQVKEIKDEFKSKITEIEKETTKLIDNKITDYDYTISGMLYYMMGDAYLHRGGSESNNEAFSYFVLALEELNKATDKSPLGFIHQDIKYCKYWNIVIAIDTEIKNRGLSVLYKIRYPKHDDIIEELRSFFRDVKTIKPVEQ